MGLIEDLFGPSKPKLDERDTSTVHRSKLDDGMYDNMRESAELFRGTIERAPELEQGEGSNEYVPHWDDLVGDLFKSLHTYEEPGVLDQEKIKPSREVNRRVMQHVIGSDHFNQMRPITKHQEIEAAFATMGMADELRTTLREKMGELAEEAKEAEKHEQQMERQREKLEELQQQVQEGGGEPSETQKEAIEDAELRQGNAQARLEKSAEKMQGMPMTVGAADAVEQAAEQGKKDAQLIASLPGVGPGEKQKLSPDEALRLAKLFKDNPRLMRVAEMLGRILRDMRFKRARRITGGHEEIVDVTIGNDLEVVLPAEKMKLMDENFEMEFIRAFYEGALLQYELRGSEEAGYGPLIICRDESGSMHGQRNIWAAAITLAMVSIARKEHRDAAVVAYASSGQQETWVFPHSEPFDAERVIDMAGHFFGGGTDATPAIAEAVRLTATEVKYTKADLVLISDGMDSFQDDDKRMRDELRDRGVRMHGVMIGDHPSQYLREMCDTLVSAYDLAGSNEATDMLAANIS